MPPIASSTSAWSGTVVAIAAAPAGGSGWCVRFRVPLGGILLPTLYPVGVCDNGRPVRAPAPARRRGPSSVRRGPDGRGKRCRRQPQYCASLPIDRYMQSAFSSSWSTASRSEEHTSELQSREKLVCRLLLEK